MRSFLDFEKPVADLEGQIQQLRRLADEDDTASVSDEVETLETKAREQLRALYVKLTPWQKTQVARHPDRPHASDYVKALITDFTPLAGDRRNRLISHQLAPVSPRNSPPPPSSVRTPPGCTAFAVTPRPSSRRASACVK